jgi:hypothetical protein
MPLLDEIKKITTTKKELRRFGITLAIVLALWSAYFFWKGNSHHRYMVPIAGALFLAGGLFPVVLKPIYRVWMTIVVIIGFMLTKVILGVLYYLVFTPIGLISRLSGKRFLSLERDANKPTYWVYRKVQPSKDEYLKQF